MSKNSAAHQKRVEDAAQKLLNRWMGGAGVTRGDTKTSRTRELLNWWKGGIGMTRGDATTSRTRDSD